MRGISQLKRQSDSQSEKLKEREFADPIEYTYHHYSEKGLSGKLNEGWNKESRGGKMVKVEVVSPDLLNA